MTNAELLAKIKAEIEKQMKFYDEKEMKAWDDSEQGDEDALWYQGHLKMCAKLLSFLSTLESEKPVPKDLEEAAGEYADKHGFRVPYDGSDNFYDEVDVKASKEGFIAGAKWQAEQDLAEMAQSKSPLSVAYANRCFENGKQAMKEQMMKEAVEAEILLTPYPTICLDDCKDYDFKDGQKVRIIIVKEEK